MVWIKYIIFSNVSNDSNVSDDFITNKSNPNTTNTINIDKLFI